MNLRSLSAIGYDMDYTLVGYDSERFEREVYDFAKASFLADGWPLEDLHFDAGMATRGLVVDIECGNLIKANRFGVVKKAMHGTVPLDFQQQRKLYSRMQVDLSSSRWVFLNTLFSLSEGCLYAQLVDRLDAGLLSKGMGYEELYRRVRNKVDLQHMEGQLKAKILKHPEKFVLPDPEAPLALLDQRFSGKKLMLITNSEWEYTKQLMAFAYDPYLPSSMNWRSLFDLVIVSARKPDFFTSRAPFFQVVSEDGLLKPLKGPLQLGQAYVGGCAAQVEADLGISGDQVLYVGDHMFGDVNVSKQLLHWRTALILRELEEEVDSMDAFEPQERILMTQMQEKEQVEARISVLRLSLQRAKNHYGPQRKVDLQGIESEIQSLREKIVQMDETIAPLAKSAAEQMNGRWGLLMRAGNDKSHLARQVERYADIYTSRVSNFLHATPYAFLRSPRGNLPHDFI